MDHGHSSLSDMSISQDYDFAHRLAQSGLTLQSDALETLQVNITKLCNQACVHCHVDASPRRREMASAEVITAILATLRDHEGFTTLDITGGAPELHPQFRDLVQEARQLKKKVIVRHNLTVTLDPHPITGASLSDLPDFFAEQGVELSSSLPCYQEFFTDKQRGSGVFEKSIKALRGLNQRGFGTQESDLVLNLVYNPSGAFLPAPQASLERDYKRELKERYGITFNRLFTITNMPIHRFKAQLQRTGGYKSYMENLVQAFNTDVVSKLMCRTMFSVSPTGEIYDCDFNQMLKLPAQGRPNLLGLTGEHLQRRNIAVADHCFGCTAGAGSSCGGAASEK